MLFIVTILNDYKSGFGLQTRFIDHLRVVTTKTITVSLVYTLHSAHTVFCLQ
jgi:hypothetical protein